MSEKQFESIINLIPAEDPQAAAAFCSALKEVLISKLNLNTANQSNIEISIIVPFLNEGNNLQALYERLTSTLIKINCIYEIIFIDDGSSDNSVPLLNEIAKNDSKVFIIELTRNFGHQFALSAGLKQSRGNAVILIDADLQDPPEAITELYSKWKEGFEVAYALRTKRKETYFKRALYTGFYRILSAVADIKIPIDAGDFSIMDRKVVDIIVSMPERGRFIRGLRSWIGFKQIGIPIERSARTGGTSQYSWNKLVNLALDGLISFSIKPLRTISFFGFLISIASLLLAVYYFTKKIAFGLTPPGFATIVVLISLFAGVQLITIGLIGEYVGRIFDETRNRPLYVIKNLINYKN